MLPCRVPVVVDFACECSIRQHVASVSYTAGLAPNQVRVVVADIGIIIINPCSLCIISMPFMQYIIIRIEVSIDYVRQV